MAFASALQVQKNKMRRKLLILLLGLSMAFGWVPPQSRSTPPSSTSRYNSYKSSGDDDDNNKNNKPILVVGATGRVGRLVVQQLLSQNQHIRALVRDGDKAQKLFGTSDDDDSSKDDSNDDHFKKLQIVVADISRYDDLYAKELEEAVKGCSAIISVSGAVRISKVTDFLPWRIFSRNVSSWTTNRDHPYYANYKGQLYLLDLAEKYNISRFVRLTGLGLSLSAFNPFTILFNTLLSFNNRWGVLCEQAIIKSKIPHVILRPGGLINDLRNTTTTHLQVDPSGSLPFPARCGRADVAALAIAALSLPSEKSYTLACRWCGEGVNPQMMTTATAGASAGAQQQQQQGTKEDGFASAEECIQHLVETNAPPAPAPRMKPYGVVVAAVTYLLAAVTYKIVRSLWYLANKLFWGT